MLSPPQLKFLAQVLQSGCCYKRTDPELLLCLLSLALKCFAASLRAGATVLQLCPCCSHRMAHAAPEGCGTPSEPGKATTKKRDLLTSNPPGFSQFPDLDYKLPGSSLVSVVGKEESKETASGNGLRNTESQVI